MTTQPGLFPSELVITPGLFPESPPAPTPYKVRNVPGSNSWVVIGPDGMVVRAFSGAISDKSLVLMDDLNSAFSSGWAAREREIAK